MRTAVVVKEDHESGMFLRRAVAYIYEGAPNLEMVIPVPDDVVVEHVQVPAEYDHATGLTLLANIEADGSVTFFEELPSA